MKKILFMTALAVSTPVFAQDEASDKIGGLRVEGHLGIERPNLNETEGGVDYVAKLSSSFAYGAEIGYDIPVSSKATVGPYVSYDLSSSKKCETASDLIGNTIYNYNLCTKSKSDLSIGVRGGLKTGSKGEVFLGLGYDVYDFDLREDLVPASTPNAAPIVFEDTKSRKGIGISFGYNHNISKNIYLGLGMRVSEFGDFAGSDFNLQRFQGHVNIGTRF
jgi:outer membrane immunogenic protein